MRVFTTKDRIDELSQHLSLARNALHCALEGREKADQAYRAALGLVAELEVTLEHLNAIQADSEHA